MLKTVISWWFDSKEPLHIHWPRAQLCERLLKAHNISNGIRNIGVFHFSCVCVCVVYCVLYAFKRLFVIEDEENTIYIYSNEKKTKTRRSVLLIRHWEVSLKTKFGTVCEFICDVHRPILGRTIQRCNGQTIALILKEEAKKKKQKIGIKNQTVRLNYRNSFRGKIVSFSVGWSDV